MDTDPNAVLAAVRRAVSAFKQADNDELAAAEADALVGYVEALDGWLTSGGLLPDGWKYRR